jgi:hypothetical protein
VARYRGINRRTVLAAIGFEFRHKKPNTRGFICYYRNAQYSTLIKMEFEMRELNSEEVMQVSGGGDIDPMDIVVGYSSSIVGLAVGFSIAGPIGSIAGAFAGFAVGTAANIGYSFASGGSDRLYFDDGDSCRLIKL